MLKRVYPQIFIWGIKSLCCLNFIVYIYKNDVNSFTLKGQFLQHARIRCLASIYIQDKNFYMPI